MAGEIQIYKGDKFQALAMKVDDLPRTLAANLGTNSAISEFDLDRISMPGSGGLAWNVPDLNGEVQPTQEIVGVIIAHGDRRAYWQKPFEETGGSPPDCSSRDGVQGRGYIRGEEKVDAQGNPIAAKTRICSKCPMSQWGSGDFGLPKEKHTNSQACNQRKLLFLLRPNDRLPICINLAPTSLGDMKKFMMRLTSQGKAHYHVVVGLKLRQEKSTANIPYSVVVPRLLADLSPEDAERMEAIAEAMRPFFERTELGDFRQEVTIEGERGSRVVDDSVVG